MGMIGRYQQKNMTACVETQNSSSFFFILVINLRKEAYLMFCHYVENLKKKTPFTCISERCDKSQCKRTKTKISSSPSTLNRQIKAMESRYMYRYSNQCC